MKRVILPVVLLTLLQAAFTITLVAPDYTGLLVDKPAANVLYYFPAIVSSLYFSLKYASETRLSKYVVRILFLPLVVIAITTILLLPVSVRIDAVRCAQSGFCTGGEPFDHMSTIFLVLFSFISAGRAIGSSILLGVTIRLSGKYRKRS